MKHLNSHPSSAALVGLLFLLPFALLNWIVGSRIEPFFSLIRPGIHTSPREYGLLAMALLLLPAGAFIALRPIIQNGAGGTRKFLLLNGVIAALLLVAFGLLVTAFGVDIYRCDILQIPNCD